MSSLVMHMVFQKRVKLPPKESVRGKKITNRLSLNDRGRYMISTRQ